MKILFICKFNRFRSKVAEAYFNKINKNSKHKAKSAGIIRGNPLDKKQVSVARKMGININSKPKGLTSKMLAWNDTSIIVADDVPRGVLRDNKKYGKGLLVWKIPDVKTNKEKEIKNIVNRIKNRIDKLMKKRMK